MKLPVGLVKANKTTYKKLMAMETASLHECVFVMHGFDPWRSAVRTFPEGVTKYGFGKSYDFAINVLKKDKDFLRNCAKI